MTTKPDSSTTRRRFLRTGAATAAATVGAGATATSTVAASDEPPQGILADGLSVEGGDRGAFFLGFLSRYDHLGVKPSAADLADRHANELNANSDAWLAYGNWLIDEHDLSPIGTVTLGVDIVMSNWVAEDDRAQTTIEATYDDEAGEYTALEWRTEPAEEPDYEVEIHGTAAEKAADELQTFRRRYIAEEDGEEHSLPDEEYVSELAGRYAPSLRFGSESKHIIQLLVGDLEEA